MLWRVWGLQLKETGIQVCRCYKSFRGRQIPKEDAAVRQTWGQPEGSVHQGSARKFSPEFSPRNLHGRKKPSFYKLFIYLHMHTVACSLLTHTQPNFTLSAHFSNTYSKIRKIQRLITQPCTRMACIFVQRSLYILNIYEYIKFYSEKTKPGDSSMGYQIYSGLFVVERKG